MTGASGTIPSGRGKEEEFARAFIFPILSCLVVGFLHRWTLSQGIQRSHHFADGDHRYRIDDYYWFTFAL